MRWFAELIRWLTTPPPKTKTPGTPRVKASPVPPLGPIPGRQLVVPPLSSAYREDFAIESDREPGVTYAVSVRDLTCTCRDFTERRASLPAGSPGRICKHVRNALFQSGAHREFPGELGRAILEDAHPKATFIVTQLPSGAEVAFAFSAGDPWIDVYAREARKGERAGACTGAYQLYGFDISRSTWSYGSGPLGAREIRTFMREHLYSRIAKPPLG